jgi:hypothetical protein
MKLRWSGWKAFPDEYHGASIQAPVGPGLYEVCRASTREQIAFGCTRNVATELCNLLNPTGLRKWLSLRRGRGYELGELEYRTWATATFAEAKSNLDLIHMQHELVMRRHSASVRM